jgi:hypothetical protein
MRISAPGFLQHQSLSEWPTYQLKENMFPLMFLALDEHALNDFKCMLDSA